MLKRYKFCIALLSISRISVREWQLEQLIQRLVEVQPYPEFITPAGSHHLLANIIGSPASTSTLPTTSSPATAASRGASFLTAPFFGPPLSEPELAIAPTKPGPTSTAATGLRSAPKARAMAPNWLACIPPKPSLELSENKKICKKKGEMAQRNDGKMPPEKRCECDGGEV